MKCALCRQKRPLEQSHVVPEFMYGPLYDQKHRFYSVSGVASKPNRVFQKGLRERLLCNECEQRLSQHERYAREVFFGTAATQPVRTPTGFVFSNLEYKPLKLFLMSLLWRLAVTSIPQYKGAVLGPHVERLRLFIVADDPGDYLTFSALVIRLTFDRRHIPGLIIPPFRTRFEGRWVWAFVIAGFFFFSSFQTDSRPVAFGPDFYTRADIFRYTSRTLGRSLFCNTGAKKLPGQKELVSAAATSAIFSDELVSLCAPMKSWPLLSNSNRRFELLKHARTPLRARESQRK